MKFERKATGAERERKIELEFDSSQNRYDVVIDGYYILGIDIPTGTVVRYEGVDDSLRLTIDENGVIEIGETE